MAVSVVAMATNMPTAERRLPLRAVSGELNIFRPKTKQMDAMIYKMPRINSGLTLGSRFIFALEHLQHSIGNQIPADDIDHGKCHCQSCEYSRRKFIILVTP
jgi:hypothetical protein